MCACVYMCEEEETERHVSQNLLYIYIYILTIGCPFSSVRNKRL